MAILVSARFADFYVIQIYDYKIRSKKDGIATSKIEY